MRNKNQLKRKWTPAALACALAVMAMLAAAPAWAYTALVHNTTGETVKVEVFEAACNAHMSSQSVGKKSIGPGGVADFHTRSGNCIVSKKYKGKYIQKSPITGAVQRVERWTAPSWWPLCCKLQHVYVKRDVNGKFYFEKK